MNRFKSVQHLHRFCSIHDPINNLHYFPRNHLTSPDHCDLRKDTINM
ncbi:hypothetical protein FHS77_001930 [Paenochrobactrum gallinarii]|uniref:Uncharacterized protein n=1 Tax=Paenochrobactrum gallinarii TaxID=643673 RepID=A0A841LT16_9HYPH|nr:hypothetical protein [Paenochrobactrum gallinarii]